MDDETSYYDRLIDATGFVPRTFGDRSFWTGHFSFASWIIRELSPAIFVELGTHTGASYFAFCQSVQEHKLNTKCHAVDTWERDETYSSVNLYNSENCSGFSSLMRMMPDKAVGHFSNDSIGLLHIDGLHSYETVKNDFESWMPKMAKGGVILFHDTNAEGGEPRAGQFFKVLKAEYPHHLEFTHGNGLGVIQVKLDDEPALGFLEKDSRAKRQVFNLFSQLGKAELHSYNSVAVDPTAPASDEKDIRHEQSLSAQFTALTEALDSNEEELRAVNHMLSEYQWEFEIMRDSLLNENRDLTNEVSRLNELVESARKWNKRSWAKRAFHKWRPEPRESKKRGIAKRIANSCRKRIGR